MSTIDNKNLRIILVGGGTMGSVSPLLGLFEEIKKIQPDASFLFIGTDSGLEKLLVEKYQIEFRAIAAGKLRRYLAWQNLLDPWLILWGFAQSVKIIWQWRPQVVVSAGSFVAVPVVVAAWLLRKKILIHQQDIRPGLANRLCAPFAKKISVTFVESLKFFNPQKTKLIGNPVRREMINCTKEAGIDFFKLDRTLPTVLVLGGGTGAQFINEIVVKCLPEWLQFCQVIHSTGRGKKIEGVEHTQYYNFEFLATEMPEAMAAADLVVSRAGLGTLTELSVLGKPTILIPIPESHQEDNAQYYKKNNAAIVIMQPFLTEQMLTQVIKDLLRDEATLNNLSRNIKKMIPVTAGKKMAEMVLEIIFQQ